MQKKSLMTWARGKEKLSPLLYFDFEVRLQIIGEEGVKNLGEGDAEAAKDVGRVGVDDLVLLARRRIDHNPKITNKYCIYLTYIKKMGRKENMKGGKERNISMKAFAE